MTVRVVDASVAAKWFGNESHAVAARVLLGGEYELHAPDFLFLELDNVLWKWLGRGLIDAAKADTTRATLRQIPIERHPLGKLQDAAYAIACRTRRTVYDSLYVALAIELDAAVVTADERLYHALEGGPLAGRIAWIGDMG